MSEALLYAANFEPEMARMYRAYEAGDTKKYEVFKRQTLKTVQRVLNASDLSPAGREEWSLVKGLVEGYESLSDEREVLLRYGLPFSRRFAALR